MPAPRLHRACCLLRSRAALFWSAGILFFALPAVARLPHGPDGPDFSAVWSPPPHVARVPSPADLALEGGLGEQLPPRDRLVAMANPHTGEQATFSVGPGGYVPPEQIVALEHFFRCRRTARELPISPRLIMLLANVAERWPGRVIEFLSGVRAPPYGAPKSKHFIGHAIDLRVRGVRSTEVRDFLWREHESVGVGYYPDGDFVHVDSRPGHVAWSGHEEATRYEVNPAWSRQRPTLSQSTP